jgi:ribonuclease P protein component
MATKKPQGASLTREDRVRLRGEFERVRKNGAGARGRILALYECPNGSPRRRLGIAVSKAVGNAVVRNRVKRLIREAFRTGRTTLAAGVDILVVARAPASDATFAQIARELSDLDAKIVQKGGAPGPKPATRRS